MLIASDKIIQIIWKWDLLYTLIYRFWHSVGVENMSFSFNDLLKTSSPFLEDVKAASECSGNRLRQQAKVGEDRHSEQSDQGAVAHSPAAIWEQEASHGGNGGLRAL